MSRTSQKQYKVIGQRVQVVAMDVVASSKAEAIQQAIISGAHEPMLWKSYEPATRATFNKIRAEEVHTLEAEIPAEKVQAAAESGKPLVVQQEDGSLAVNPEL